MLEEGWDGSVLQLEVKAQKQGLPNLSTEVREAKHPAISCNSKSLLEEAA